MITDARDPMPGTREHFLRVTQVQRWGTIQEYVDLCRAQGYFTPAFYRKATAHMERIHVRRMLRQVKDGRGWPTVGNIVRVGPNGWLERVFMQEELFGPEEYRQIVAYHYGMARHHLSRRRPTATTPRRATASSCRCSARTTARETAMPSPDHLRARSASSKTGRACRSAHRRLTFRDRVGGPADWLPSTLKRELNCGRR
jgi:hypothetical protein